MAGHGIGVTVVDPRWTQAGRRGGRRRAPAEHRLVAVVEDNGRAGGFGDAVCRLLRDHDVDVPVKTFGLPQEFLDHGTRPDILAAAGLTPQHLARQITEAVARRTPDPATDVARRDGARRARREFPGRPGLASSVSRSGGAIAVGPGCARLTMLRVAVIGSGPAGLYTAEALVKQAAALPVPVRVRVDVLDRLPTPYGLVRYGVAPDHKSIKSVATYLRRVLEHPDVEFHGGVHLGRDVTRQDLLAAYDAVVYATGAMRDARLGIPGEDLPGSHAATDFVNWYCGHPDVALDAFTLDAESVAVIGVGNVAVDVARILARDPAELHETDIPEPVMAALRSCTRARGQRHRPARPGAGQVHHQGAARARRPARRVGLGGPRRAGPRHRRSLGRLRRPRRVRPPRPRQPGRHAGLGLRLRRRPQAARHLRLRFWLQAG